MIIAVSAPISMLPSDTRWPPNQMIATMVTFVISMTDGNINACIRPTRSVAWARLSFAVAKRSIS